MDREQNERQIWMARENQMPDEERQLFEEAMQGVRPIEEPNLAPGRRARDTAGDAPDDAAADASLIRQERAARKPGVQDSVLRNLRTGRIPIEGQLDLHGYTQPEARAELESFIRQSQAEDRQRAVRVIHGKGHGSRDGKSALREAVMERLEHSDAVLAFCEAGPGDGGSGAVRVLLRRRGSYGATGSE